MNRSGEFVCVTSAALDGTLTVSIGDVVVGIDAGTGERILVGP